METMAASYETTEVEREIAEALDVGVLLGGRRYRRHTAVTFERNVYTATAARDTGLVKALQGFDPLHDEVSDQIESLVLDAFTNGSMYRLLAGALCEDETPWTPVIAQTNTDRFRRVTDPVDQAALFDIASWVLLDFFLNAGASWRTFLKYLQSSSLGNGSGVVGDQSESSSEPTTAGARDIAETSILASGRRSSGPSPADPIASR